MNVEALEADALRAFGAFARHRSFTAAAAELRISQPSLHVKITKLAAGLGVTLYERRGRALHLTPQGERLAALERDVRARVAEFAAGGGGQAPLTLAAGRGAFLWVIAEGTAALARSGHVLRVSVLGREPALAALAAGRADLAVVGYDPPPRRLAARLLATYPQVLVVPAGDRLAAGGSVRVADLAGVPLIVPSEGRPHRRALERAFLDAGADLAVAAEADGWDLGVHFVGLGLGAAVVNGCVRLPAGLCALPVADLPPVRYWAVWRPSDGERLAPVVAELAGGAVTATGGTAGGAAGNAVQSVVQSAAGRVSGGAAENAAENAAGRAVGSAAENAAGDAVGSAAENAVGRAG